MAANSIVKHFVGSIRELVPALIEDDFTLTQSLSMIEYLEEKFPKLPVAQGFATACLIRAFSLNIACDIHPLNNLRVLQYLSKTLNASDEQNRMVQTLGHHRLKSA